MVKLEASIGKREMLESEMMFHRMPAIQLNEPCCELG